MNEHVAPAANVAILVAETPAIVFTDTQKAEQLFAHIEREIAEFVPDLTSDKGRKAIASLAYKVARTKTAIDEAGAELNEAANRQIAKINAERRKFRERLDALKDRAREPLTKWEAAEAERVGKVNDILNRIGIATIVMADETADTIAARLGDVETAEIDPALFQDGVKEAETHKARAVQSLRNSLERARKDEADRAELARLRAAQEERERREAEEAAARRAEEERVRQEQAEAERQRLAAEAEKQRIAEAAEQAQRDAEAAAAEERRRAEAAHAAELARLEAEKQALAEAQEREKREREEAAAKITADEERRAADQQHRADVMRAAKEALMEAGGISEAKAKQIVLAILAGQIPNVTLKF